MSFAPKNARGNSHFYDRLRDLYVGFACGMYFRAHEKSNSNLVVRRH